MNKLSNKLLFMYVVLFIFIVFMFSLKNIKLNIVFGTIVASVVMYYIHNKKQDNLNKTEQIKTQTKIELINADDNILEKNDMVNFLFSTQEFYYYNPNAHNDLIYNLKVFFQLHDEVIKDNTKAGTNFQKMDDYKRHSLNSMNSIIFKIQSDKRLLNKLNNAVSKLEDILISYQNEIHYFHLNNIHENGYNTETKLITFGPNPVNSYNIDNSADYNNISDKFSYNIF
jgi:hypothetical protein